MLSVVCWCSDWVSAPACKSRARRAARSASGCAPSAAAAAAPSGWPSRHASRKATSANPIERQTTSSSGRVKRAPSACQSSSASAGFGAGAVARPDAEDRQLVEPCPARGRMRAQRQRAERVGRQSGEQACVCGRCVGSSVGFGPEALQPCDAGQIGQVGCRFEGGEKVRKASAVVQQAPVARRRCTDVTAPLRRGTIRCRPAGLRRDGWLRARRCTPFAPCCGRSRRRADRAGRSWPGARHRAGRTTPA